MIDTPRDFAREGRADYAGRLARWLKRQGITAATADSWTDGQWFTAARQAGMAGAVKRGRAPSEETRRMVVALLTPSPVHRSHYVGTPT